VGRATSRRRGARAHRATLDGVVSDPERHEPVTRDAADALRNAISIQEPLVRQMPGRPQLLAGLGHDARPISAPCAGSDAAPRTSSRTTSARSSCARASRSRSSRRRALQVRSRDESRGPRVPDASATGPRAAFDLFHSAIELSREVVALQPEATDNVVQLAHILDLLGGHYAQHGALDEAEPCFVESLALRETTRARSPRSAQLPQRFGPVLANLAHLRRDQQRFDEVRALDERGFEHQRLAVERNPDQPQYQLNLIVQMQVLAGSLIGAGDHRALCASIQACTRALSRRPDFHHFAAFFMAHAARLAREDSALEEDEQGALVESYERACLDELRATIAARRTDVNALVADPVFEPLRENEEFKKLCVAARPR
jgi:hypothetical protein